MKYQYLIEGSRKYHKNGHLLNFYHALMVEALADLISS